MLLGVQLRRLREDRGITRERAGYQIRCSESKISRLELGRIRFKERDVADLLTYYGIIDDAEREPLLTLAREANVPGWWQSYSDAVPGWFDAFVGLEAAAELIRAYEVQFVPGLLQTEDYARAVMAPDRRGVPAGVAERRVRVRMGRQKVLAGPDPPRLWAVVDEAALRRPIGGPKVMRTQLEHLIDMTERPNIVLQVMPFDFGGHAAEGGAFRILRFPEPDLPNVVYLEQLGGSSYLDKPEDVDRYEEAMTRLVIDASDPAATIEILRRLIEDINVNMKSR
jgi:transcriptional regulator with XRE-family HTH domain